MKRLKFTTFAATTILICACNNSRINTIDIPLPEEFNEQTVKIYSYDDSTLISETIITDNKVRFDFSSDSIEMPLLATLTIEGKTIGFTIIEPGNSTLEEDSYIASGTPLNDKLKKACTTADSIEKSGTIADYLTFLKNEYTSNKENPAGLFLAVKLSRLLEKPQLDSLLAEASPLIKNSRTITRYYKAAELRANTLPGKHFIDFEAKQPNNSIMKLSDFAEKGKYLLVDFWASWCPWCIKGIPALKELKKKYPADKFEILGVAVRDEANDTKSSVEKHGIEWTVMYNAERIPYDIYGFTGIPHLMLIGPDGTIIYRGESVEEVDIQLEDLLK